MDVGALWQQITSSLERFIIAFVAYLKGEFDKQQEINQKSSDKLIDVYKEILRIEDENKKLSDKDLARDTTIDD